MFSKLGKFKVFLFFNLTSHLVSKGEEAVLQIFNQLFTLHQLHFFNHHESTLKSYSGIFEKLASVRCIALPLGGLGGPYRSISGITKSNVPIIAIKSPILLPLAI